ncbi:hypothetical protein VTK56DRAFT_7930 [Thermocarpiscus australiensis]
MATSANADDDQTAAPAAFESLARDDCEKGPATDTAAVTRIAASYPSPTPSASQAFTQSYLEPENAAKPDRKAKKRRADCDQSAKDYWSRQYAHLKRHSTDQFGLKRKQNGEDQTKVKRRRLATEHVAGPQREQDLPPANDTDGDDPIAGEAKLGDAALQMGVCDEHGARTIESMNLLRSQINLDDPQAVRGLALLEEVTLSFGHDKCKAAEGGKWKLSGFDTSLYHHQIVGVRWMLGRELHPNCPKGGILADEMGLGKTVQVLACLSQNPPGKTKKKGSPSKTLIVAPKRLPAQWSYEIAKHCPKNMAKGVYIYAAGQVIQRQLPPLKRLRAVEDMRAEGNGKWIDELRKEAGELFQIDWYRVVLDEGHVINNRSSQTSLACRLLVSRHRWVLSGTPMTNNTDEFFPYLDFLWTKYGSFGQYQDAMGDVENEAQKENLQRVFQEVSLKRRVGDKFMGRPIFQIPETHPTKVIEVDFSSLERKIHEGMREQYNVLRERAKGMKGLSKMLNNGFRFVYLWGGMNPALQETSIRVFLEVPEVTVMLISVSCGAHGLNLTAANRAIVFDHWWHKCLEQQAFARIHRIGQSKEVYTAKLVAKGSMDDKIMKMQDTKEGNISAAMGAGSVRRKPTQREIVELLCKDGELDEELFLADLEEEGEDGSESESDSDNEISADEDGDDVESDSESEKDDKNKDSDYQPDSSEELGDREEEVVEDNRDDLDAEDGIAEDE